LTLSIGVARGVHWVHVQPQGEKKNWGLIKSRVATHLENLENLEKSRNSKVVREKSGKVEKVREKSGNFMWSGKWPRCKRSKL